MRTFGALITFLLVSLSASSQPFTESELAWPSGAAQAGYQFYYMLMNQVLTNTLPGSGRRITFAAGTPSHGTVSGLDANTGTNEYTPANNFTGSDAFQYTVASGTHRANGQIAVAVLDPSSLTNTGCVTNCFDTCPSPFNPYCTLGCFAPGTVNFGAVFYPTNFDTNLDITIRVYDTMGQVDSSFFHTGGNNELTWSPAATLYNDVLVFKYGLIDPTATCFNPNNNQMCIIVCAPFKCATTENISNVVYTQSGPNNWNFTVNRWGFSIGFVNSTATDLIFDLCNNSSTNRTLTMAGKTSYSIAGTQLATFTVLTNGTTFDAMSLSGTHSTAAKTYSIPIYPSTQAQPFTEIKLRQEVIGSGSSSGSFSFTNSY